MLTWFLIGGALIAGISIAVMNRTPEKAEDIPEEEPSEADSVAAEQEDVQPTETFRATITRVLNDMNPVTLRSWTRLECRDENGTLHKMSFDGEYGIYLKAGETGILEHRDGAFVSFEKDSGEVVAVLYRIPAEEK